MISAMPIKAMSGAIIPMSSATRSPVTVVPMLAPMMIHTACFKSISLELTNPTTITVVAEEDWMTAVIAVPTSTPRMGFVVSLSMSFFIRLPATASRLVLIMFIP